MFFDPSVLPFLAGRVTVLHRFLTLLTQNVQREQLPAARIEVRGTVDPEEDTTQVLVRLWLSHLSDREIREYHRAFGQQVDEWMVSLSDEQREFFTAKISFQIRRGVDA